MIFLACSEEKHFQEANISSIRTECTHPGPTGSETVASQDVLQDALGIHSYPRLKQIDLGSIVLILSNV